MAGALPGKVIGREGSKDSEVEFITTICESFGLTMDGDGQCVAFDATFVPPDQERHRNPPTHIPSLPMMVSADMPVSSKNELEILGILGVGGMGQVNLAKQLPLGRDVAVKTLKSDNRSSDAATVLLREAWMTGVLEHPNIVPVYSLGRSDNNVPMLVMKRIEGEPWRIFFQDGKKVAKVAGQQDPLDWHLRVLMQVCNAVHFAHSRGIIHRDLKPDNVMIGEFGEVYVLDWGIAVSLKDDGTRRFPLASEVSSPAGTPVYMAPEMASGMGKQLGVHTDVYLLGGLLHEVVTGEQPHQGKRILDVMLSAYRSRPKVYPPHVPKGLAEICLKAMDARPERRYAGVDAFKGAIETFLLHRQSMDLVEEAMAGLERLENLLDDGGQDLDRVSSVEVYKVFGAARFGFEQALRLWKENTEARRGLQGALERMIQFELANDGYKAACVFLSELPEKRSDLEVQLAEVKGRLESEKREIEDLKQIRKDTDVEFGRLNRALVAAVIGVIWALIWVARGYLTRNGSYQLSVTGYLGSSLLFLAFVVLAIYFGRNIFLKNAANRKIFGSLLVMGLAGFLHKVIVVTTGIPLYASLSQELVIYFLVLAIMALAIDRTFIWGVPAFVVFSLCTASIPAYAYELFGLGTMVGMFSVAYALYFRPGNKSGSSSPALLDRFGSGR